MHYACERVFDFSTHAPQQQTPENGILGIDNNHPNFYFLFQSNITYKTTVIRSRITLAFSPQAASLSSPAC
jgi:hypothetical protein